MRETVLKPDLPTCDLTTYVYYFICYKMRPIPWTHSPFLHEFCHPRPSQASKHSFPHRPLVKGSRDHHTCTARNKVLTHEHTHTHTHTRRIPSICTSNLSPRRAVSTHCKKGVSITTPNRKDTRIVRGFPLRTHAPSHTNMMS